MPGGGGNPPGPGGKGGRAVYMSSQHEHIQIACSHSRINTPPGKPPKGGGGPVAGPPNCGPPENPNPPGGGPPPDSKDAVIWSMMF